MSDEVMGVLGGIGLRRLVIDDLRLIDFGDSDYPVYARTPEFGLKLLLEEGPWHEVYLDHDMGYNPITLNEQNIRPVVKELERLAFEGTKPDVEKIFIITGNPVAASWMARGLIDYSPERSFRTYTMLKISESIDEMHEEWAAMDLTETVT